MSDTKTLSPISLTMADDGCIHLAGELSFKTVPDFFSTNRDVLRQINNNLDVDLNGINRADSAGIALLIEWQRQAQQQKRTICFHNIPQQLLAIARLSGVETILTLSS